MFFQFTTLDLRYKHDQSLSLYSVINKTCIKVNPRSDVDSPSPFMKRSSRFDLLSVTCCIGSWMKWFKSVM